MSEKVNFISGTVIVDGEQKPFDYCCDVKFTHTGLEHETVATGSYEVLVEGVSIGMHEANFYINKPQESTN